MPFDRLTDLSDSDVTQKLNHGSIRDWSYKA